MTITADRPAAKTADLNPTRTKTTPTPKPGTPDAAGKSDPPMSVDPCSEPNGCSSPSPGPANDPVDDTEDKTYVGTTVRHRWARTWPSLLAVVTLSAVGGPAAVASYRHARDVIAQHGDPVMAPWLALTTDGMLLAALVVIWVRRHRSEPVKAGPWAAFWAGMAATIAANLAAAHPTPIGIVVALWPPVCLAITLELVALVAYPTQQHPTGNGSRRGGWTGQVPDDAHPAPGPVPAEPAREARAPQTREAGHDTDGENRHPLDDVPAEPTAKTRRGPAARPTGTNGHPSGLEHAAPGQFQRDASSPAGQPTVPEHRHNDQAPSGGVPDDHILAWLRERERTTGQVPGRRQMIEQWALGSTRADRLRATVIKEAASKATTPAG